MTRQCEECGGSLDGMRADATVCGAVCRAERSRRLRGVHYVAEPCSAPRSGSNARSGLQVSYRKVEAMLNRVLQGRPLLLPEALAQETTDELLRPLLSVKQRARLQTPDPRR